MQTSCWEKHGGKRPPHDHAAVARAQMRTRATRCLAVALGALTLLSPAAGAGETRRDPRPNIVLILADDAGVETVGAYGGSIATPRLDRLAREGVRFDNAHATPLCTPSRVRLLTGRYSFRNYKAFAHLGIDEPTMAKVLQRAGYRTAVAGKWQLSGNPLDGVPGSVPRQAGFDEWSVWGGGVDFIDDGCQHWGPTLDTNGLRRTFPGEFGSDLVHRFALDFIGRNEHQPFFLFYSMILPHDPWVATPARPGASAPEQQFEAMVEYLDFLVGDLVDQIDRRGLADNTLVVFVADNGSHVLTRSLRHGAPVQGGKSGTTDAGTHVPLILRWPGRLAVPATNSQMVDLTDLFATIVTAAGQGRAAADSDGYDLMPALVDGAAPRRDAIFMDYALGWWPFDTVRYAFTARWKLYDDGRFFDIATDPLEKSPLQQAGLPTEAGTVRDRLARVLADIGDHPLTLADPHFKPGFDPDTIDYEAVGLRLKARNSECGDPARAAQPAPSATMQ